MAAGVGAAVVPESAALRFGDAKKTRIAALSDTWARRKLLICMTPHGAQLTGVSALAQALASC